MITNRLSAVGVLFALLALSQLGLSSCTVDSLTSIPFVHRFAGTALRPGQSIEWDEVTIDSNVLPSSFGDSSAMIKSISANYQYRVFHVIVTVPDSTVPKFQVDRRITTWAPIDSMTPEGNRISRTVVYGSSVKSYDYNSNLISTYTASAGDSAQDLADLPFFEYRPDTVVTDSERTEFVSQLTSAGLSVTNLGSSGFRVSSSFTDAGLTYNAAAFFDHDYLLLTRSVITLGADTALDETYSYSSIGGYLINTDRQTRSASTLSATAFGDFQSIESDIDPQRRTSRFFKRLTLSNIQMP